MENRIAISVCKHVAHVRFVRSEKMNALDNEMFEVIETAGKQVLNEAPYLDADDGLLLESKLQDKFIGSPNQIEAISAQRFGRVPQGHSTSTSVQVQAYVDKCSLELRLSNFYSSKGIGEELFRFLVADPGHALIGQQEVVDFLGLTIFWIPALSGMSQAGGIQAPGLGFIPALVLGSGDEFFR